LSYVPIGCCSARFCSILFVLLPFCIQAFQSLL
jgi:hypothetical protein